MNFLEKIQIYIKDQIPSSLLCPTIKPSKPFTNAQGKGHVTSTSIFSVYKEMILGGKKCCILVVGMAGSGTRMKAMSAYKYILKNPQEKRPFYRD